jgi:hypothetical protein
MKLKTINTLLGRIGLRLILTIGTPPDSSPIILEVMTVRRYNRTYAKKATVSDDQ